MRGLRVAPLWLAGLRCRCPRCGQGALYTAYLKIAPRCDACGLNLAFADAGDGPAVFVTFVAGAFIAGMAAVIEINFSPPYWVHALIWLPLTLTLCLALLPVFKATLVALQYRHQAGEGRRE